MVYVQAPCEVTLIPRMLSCFWETPQNQQRHFSIFKFYYRKFQTQAKIEKSIRISSRPSYIPSTTFLPSREGRQILVITVSTLHVSTGTSKDKKSYETSYLPVLYFFCLFRWEAYLDEKWFFFLQYYGMNSAPQVLYHLSHASSPFFFRLFFRWVLCLPGASLKPWSSQFSLPK
jgi:hypothetical protein